MTRVVSSILQILAIVLRNYTFTMRTGLARGLKRRYGSGFKPRFALTAEEKFLLELDLRGKTVFDIGGYIGIYSMFFARAVGAAGRVITFEPHPGNYRELVSNVHLNGFRNISVLPVGIGRERAAVELFVDPVYPSRGFVAHARPARQVAQEHMRTVPIEMVALDSLMRSGAFPNPDFIKIDVEGLELDVLYGMTEVIDTCKPRLFIEIHYAIPELQAFLLAKGYALYHVEAQTLITDTHAPAIPWGHLYCT